MKKLFLYIPVMIVLAVSCEKEDMLPSLEGNEPASQVEMVTETISGSLGIATKSTISDVDASFAWTEGDNVAVHISNGNYSFTTDGAAIDAVESSKASFTVAYEAGYSRNAFAVYPCTIVAKNAANYGQEDHTLDVTLPDSYTLAQVSGETSPCPMISTDEAGTSWNFFQLCGLMRLTVDSVPTSAKRLEFDFNGKKVCGDFSIASPVVPGTSAIETSADDAHDVITITKDGSDAVLGATSLTVNIPLPVGEYTNVTIKAFDVLVDGSAILTITRPFNCMLTGPMAFKRTATFPSAKTAFRGYEVSTGILKRDASTSPATYSLTSGAMILTADPDGKNEHYVLPEGCNPFEQAVYYKQSASLNKYFHKWLTLRSELGANGNNINATSEYLPAGWRFPTGGDKTSSDWGKIIFGTPKSTITVNGTAVTSNAYAMVRVSLESGNSYGVAAGTYYGMLLLRDGITIPSGYLSKVGPAKYVDNPVLNETKFEYLIQKGCLFVSATGYYSETFKSWRELNTSWQDGDYWSSNFREATKFYYFTFSNATSTPSVTSSSTSGDKNFQVVKLVKPVVD